MSSRRYVMVYKRPVRYDWTRTLRPIPPVDEKAIWLESLKAKELAREYGVKVD